MDTTYRVERRVRRCVGPSWGFVAGGLTLPQARRAAAEEREFEAFYARGPHGVPAARVRVVRNADGVVVG